MLSLIVLASMFHLLFVLSTAGAQALAFCPSGCRCNDEALAVECLHAPRLDVLPITLNPSIRRLVLRNNKIRSVDSAFQFYSELTYVDLGKNQMALLPDRSFESQRQLRDLHLAQNHISTLTNRTFVGLGQLRRLSLRENRLQRLDAGALAPLVSLEELDLGKNAFSTLEAGAFMGPAQLRVLHLDDNLLSVVPGAALAALPLLAHLHLDLNAFVVLGEQAFAGTPHLTTLGLRTAVLAGNVSERAFAGLTELHSLDLAENRLSHVPSAQLAPLSHLEHLSLAANEFTALEESALGELVALRSLDLSGCARLRVVRAGALSANQRLENLTLAGCEQLDTLESGALGALAHPSLRTLDLSGAHLQRLPPTLLDWSELRLLELTGNPLACDCGARWLVRLSRARNLTGATCGSPATLAGTQLMQLDDAQLSCALGAAGRHLLLGAFVASAALIFGLLAAGLYCFRRSVQRSLHGCRLPAKHADYHHHHHHHASAPPPPPHHAAPTYHKAVPFSRDDFRPVPVTEL